MQLRYLRPSYLGLVDKVAKVRKCSGSWSASGWLSELLFFFPFFPFFLGLRSRLIDLDFISFVLINLSDYWFCYKNESQPKGGS